ncbi:hypothetical protein KAM385_12640 [Aeromonas hydrophila]|nr:hypothetical protein KAM385_12640 [Aeromonas hydrophila]
MGSWGLADWQWIAASHRAGGLPVIMGHSCPWWGPSETVLGAGDDIILRIGG